MSYCRYSSDNWMCDVYVYEAADGVCVHVAGSRYVTPIPKLPSWNDVSSEEYWKVYKEQMKTLETA